MIKSQRNLFNIPDDIAYLNTAYMSPLLNSVITAIEEGARLKSQPWRLGIPDFYDQVDQARLLFSKIICNSLRLNGAFGRTISGNANHAVIASGFCSGRINQFSYLLKN